MQYQQKEVYIGGFNPVYECVQNGFFLIGAGKLGVMFSIVVIRGDILFWVSAFIGVVTLLRAKRWYDKWQDRELRIKCIDINYIERLSNEITPQYKKQQAITAITNRASKVWWSYLLFFTPHMALLGFCWWLLDAWGTTG